MDPPPIVRLTVRGADGSLIGLHTPGNVDISQCMVMAELFTADRLQPCSLVANPATTTVIPDTPHIRTIGDSTMSVLHLAVPPPISARNLTGSTGASGDLLKDLTGNYGIFFAFPDLSVRTDGVYTLKFSFVMLPDSPLVPSPVLATVFSAPFEIFHAKRFPGMIKSTPLSKMLFDQGVRIPLRKETRVGRNRNLVLSEPEGVKATAEGGEGGEGAEDMEEIEVLEDKEV
ncbi:hypothetical protein BGZ95_003585 [Linnemannia exigua]|uniref:Velvet domain-containing protein n=1 Tax=Linnemannia exigua TaxID=604196 RepID=A0AAD4H3L4_9FUNG|nr:hypothetical protein BGZ95_003585 [Linnemannia exigua]